MFLVCLVLSEVFLIVCYNTPNPTNKAINLSVYLIIVCFLIHDSVISLLFVSNLFACLYLIL